MQRRSEDRLARWLVFMALAIVCTLPAVSSAEQRTVTLFDQLSSSVTPAQIFFFVDVPGEDSLRRLEGIAVEEPDSLDDAATRRWYLGTQLQVPAGVEALLYSVIVIAENDHYEYLSPRWWNSEFDPVASAEIPALQELLAKAGDDLKSWMAQYKAQEESLKRLKADATVIARLERVEQMHEQIELRRREMEHLEQDVARLKKFLAFARDVEAPRNFAVRERDLVRQVRELADASRTAESGELARRSAAETELQHQLRIIEATRSISLARLRQRLEELRSYRQSREGRAPAEAEGSETLEGYLQ